MGHMYYVDLCQALKDAGVTLAKSFAQLHRAPGLSKDELGVFVYLEHMGKRDTVHISSDSSCAELKTCLPSGHESDKVACSRVNSVQVIPVEWFNNEDDAVEASHEQSINVSSSPLGLKPINHKRHKSFKLVRQALSHRLISG